MPKVNKSRSGSGKLFEIIQSRLPDNAQILELAQSELSASGLMQPTVIVERPSEFVQMFRDTAYKIYLQKEEHALREGLKEYASSRLKFPADQTEMYSFLDSAAADLNKMFLSLSQSRKSRAGAALEHVIERMFCAGGVPFENARLLNGKPDFILPSKAHYERNPTDCLIVTVKQTLRERWRQVTTEGHRARKVYLITLDKALKTGDLNEMNVSGVALVVPSDLKSKKYVHAENVMSFEYFFEHFLQPALKRWKTAK